MSWWEYVSRIAQTDRQRDIAETSAIDASNLTRWKKGAAPGPLFVAQFARAYDRPVLEAFVAAGFLTEAEAKARPAAAPDYTQLTNNELLELVRARMAEEVSDSEATSPQKTTRHLTAAASGGAKDDEAQEAAEAGKRAAAEQAKNRAAMNDKS